MVKAELRIDAPEDWSIVTLGDYSQIFRGGSPRPIQDFLTTSDHGVNWIKIGDVDAGAKYIESTEEKIIPEGVSRSRIVYKGDLILSNSMSFGRPYIMNIEGCIHDGWLVIQKYDKAFNKDYLYYALSSEMTMRQYVSMAAGSGVQNLNKEKVSKVILPCPEISEQGKIAEALSAIDALIQDMQKLIEKKMNVRQGTLQLLMAGKKRVQGFKDPWKEVLFGDVCVINAPMVNPQESKYALLPHIGNESIDKHTGKLLSYNKVIDDNLISGKYFFTENDVLYGKIAFCAAERPPVRLPAATLRCQRPGLIDHFMFNHNIIMLCHSLKQRVG